MKVKSILTLTSVLVVFSSNLFAQYVCEGECVNGYGLKKSIEQKAYMKGKFLNGVLQEGKVVFPNGDVFEGKFKDNFLKEGSKVLHTGKRLVGKFYKNVLIEGKITEPNGVARNIKLKQMGINN